MDILIGAIVETVFGSLAEASGLSDWLRQRLGRDPEKLAFQHALMQALADSASHFPGCDLQYFTEILRDIGGPLLARTLQPAATLPNTEELTELWVNHLEIDKTTHYRSEFEQFVSHFLAKLIYQIENQQPLQWIVQARRQRSTEEATQRMAEATEQSASNLEGMRQEIARLSNLLATALPISGHLTVNTEGAGYNAGVINAQNVSMRDLTIVNNNYYNNIPASTPDKRGSEIVSSLLLQNIETLSDRLTTEVEKRLDAMRNAWREGRKADAAKWISELRNDSTSWIALSDETKANILCFEARLCLDSGDRDRSKALVQEAASLTSTTSSVARIQALVSFYENGSAPALEALSTYDDIDSVNLRAALLLELGKPEECLALLGDTNLTNRANAETLRVRSLAYLLSRNIAQAQLEIQKAIELAPNWENIREASALVNYHSALSSGTITELSPVLPEPIAPIFLKSDDESRFRLRQAAQLFHELASNPEKSAKERVRLRIWEMASLANDPEQQQAAEVLCRQLLQEHPAEYTAIAWATARGYKVDLQASLVALEKYYQEAPANVQMILGLVLCYFWAERYKEAAQLLENSNTLFEEYQAMSIWAHWYVRSLLADNDQDNSELVIEDLKQGPNQKDVNDILLVHLAQKTGDWDQVTSHFKQVYKETRDPHALLSYCETLTTQSKWDEFTQIASTLIEEVGTGSIVEFVVKGIYNAKRYAYCIELLNKHSNLFPDGRLPKGMQYLRLDCQHALGILPAAITEAEKLFREEPSTAHLMKLLWLYYESGDLKKLAVEARLLLDRTDVRAEHLLQVVQLVQHENRELAISLWRQAYFNGLSDALKGPAINLGFNLKLEDSPEHMTLMKQIMMLSQRDETGIIMKEAKDFVAFFKDVRDRNVELHRKYQAGQLPIHLVSSMLNWSLGVLYHRAEGYTYTDELGQQFPLFVRHGGKQLLAGFPDAAPNWRLNLDVTAVLLAEHLGILRKVESTYAPLRIPSNLIPALTQMRDSLFSHQPSRLDAISNVLRYVDQNRILSMENSTLSDNEDEHLPRELGAERIALLKEAMSNRGYVVDFLPITKQDFSGEEITLSEAVSAHLVNTHALIQVLWEEGEFDDDEYAGALEHLGTEKEKGASVTRPVVGAKLYCNEVIAEQLAKAKLLPVLVEHFQVMLTSDTIKSMRTALRLNDQNLQTSEWLNNLRDRISTGISKGIYEIIPTSPARQDVTQKDIQTSAVEQCFLSLLSFDITEKDVLWIDDRYISTYLHRDGASIIGINEILKALVASGELQKKKYYNKLIALRAANVHFIPLHTDEVLHHLTLARITNGKLIETNALKIIRQHVAMSLLYGHFLQHPPLPDKAPNAMGEVAYITELSRTIADTLKTVWAEFHQKEDECIARVEWLLSSLYLDLSTTRRLIWTNPEQNDLYLMAMSLAHLLQCGFELRDLDEADQDFLVKRYYEWLDRRLLSKSCENNPLLAASIASILKDLFRSIQQELSEKFGSKNFEYEIAKGLQRYYTPLPEVIQREMRQDSDFMSSLGLVHLEVVDFGDIVFLTNDFYQAASMAINGQSTTIEAIMPSIEVEFHPVDGEMPHHRFAYVHPETNKNRFVEEEELAMLSHSPTWRETVLRRNRQWFDCNAGDFEHQVALIASAEDAIKRVETVKAWRASSIAEFYQQLNFKIRRQEPISTDDLIPPSLDGFARHLRLSLNFDTEQSFKITLEQAATDLIATEGLANAMIRLSGLPVTLPQPIMAAASKLSIEEQHQLVKQLLLRIHSVMGRIHLVHLLLHISDQSLSFVRLSRWISIRLLSDTAKSELNAFLTILIWANDAFNSQPYFRELPIPLRLSLVWTHTHHLINLFAASGAPMDWLHETFERFKNSKSIPELFERDSQYWYDVAHPYRINMLRLLLAGLSYSFDSHREYFTEQIKLITASLAFMNGEEQPVPAVALLKNLSLVYNSLDSFLSIDFAAAVEMFWGKDVASMFSHEKLQIEQKKLIEDYLKQPKNRDALSTWVWFGATISDLPLDKQLQEQLTTAISRTNFAHYYKVDALKASVALRTASLRLRYIDDNAVHLHVRDQLIKAAQILAQFHTSGYFHIDHKDPDKSREQIYFSLFEIALNIAHANSSNNIPEEFSALLEQVLLILPSFPDVTRPLLQRLYEDTPIPISRQFSRLYVWSRTS